MSRLEFNNMPDDNLLENDTSNFDNPLNGNELDTPSNTMPNRSPEGPEAGSSGSPEGSDLIGPFNPPNPEKKHTPRTEDVPSFDTIMSRSGFGHVTPEIAHKAGSRVEPSEPIPARLFIPGEEVREAPRPSTAYVAPEPARVEPNVGGAPTATTQEQPAAPNLGRKRGNIAEAGLDALRRIPEYASYTSADIADLEPDDPILEDIEARVGPEALDAIIQRALGGVSEKPVRRPGWDSIRYRTPDGLTDWAEFPFDITNPDKTVTWVRQKLYEFEIQPADNPTEKSKLEASIAQRVVTRLISQTRELEEGRIVSERYRPFIEVARLLEKEKAALDQASKLSDQYDEMSKADQLRGITRGLTNASLNYIFLERPEVMAGYIKLDEDGTDFLAGKNLEAITEKVLRAASAAIRLNEPKKEGTTDQDYAEYVQAGAKMALVNIQKAYYYTNRALTRDELISQEDGHILTEAELTDNNRLVRDSNTDWSAGSRNPGFKALRPFHKLRQYLLYERGNDLNINTSVIKGLGKTGMSENTSRDFFTDFTERLVDTYTKRIRAHLIDNNVLTDSDDDREKLRKIDIISKQAALEAIGIIVPKSVKVASDRELPETEAKPLDWRWSHRDGTLDLTGVKWHPKDRTDEENARLNELLGYGERYDVKFTDIFPAQQGLTATAEGSSLSALPVLSEWARRNYGVTSDGVDALLALARDPTDEKKSIEVMKKAFVLDKPKREQTAINFAHYQKYGAPKDFSTRPWGEMETVAYMRTVARKTGEENSTRLIDPKKIHTLAAAALKETEQDSQRVRTSQILTPEEQKAEREEFISQLKLIQANPFARGIGVFLIHLLDLWKLGTGIFKAGRR